MRWDPTKLRIGGCWTSCQDRELRRHDASSCLRPLEGLANTVGGRTGRPWKLPGRSHSDKPPSSPQELDGILSPITRLGGQMGDQLMQTASSSRVGSAPQ